MMLLKRLTGQHKPSTSNSWYLPVSMAVRIQEPMPYLQMLTISVVLAGTNGEAVTLSHKEKSDLVSTTRKLANELGRPDVTITLGCGGQSTREVIAETRLASEAGADFALVLVPSYFHFAMNEDAIVEFFQEVSVVIDPCGLNSDLRSSSPTPHPFPSSSTTSRESSLVLTSTRTCSPSSAPTRISSVSS